MKYDRVTRLLHWGLALGVTVQMLASLVMVYPRPGRLPNQWYELHETLGQALLALLAAHWLWSLGRSARAGGIGLLLPWFSAARMRDLAADIFATIAEIRRGRLPADDAVRSLPAAVQGLGLLVATALAATGAVLAWGMAPDGALSPVLHAVKELHEGLAPLMWAYLVVHPALGLLHQLAGHRSLSRMFLGRG